MKANLESFTIGAFAEAAGVNVETIRFYQRKGLLPEPAKPHGSIRRYGDADVTRVRFVKAAQRLGFSLDAIAELLRLDDGTHCEEASALAESKLKDVREKIALRGQLVELCSRVAACHDVACAKCLGQLGRHLRPGFACEHLSSWVLAWVLLPQSQA